MNLTNNVYNIFFTLRMFLFAGSLWVLSTVGLNLVYVWAFQLPRWPIFAQHEYDILFLLPF